MDAVLELDDADLLRSQTAIPTTTKSPVPFKFPPITYLESDPSARIYWRFWTKLRNNYILDVEPTDFELVLDCVRERPGLTGREITAILKRKGHARFTSKLVNQILYRLLTAQLVSRDGSGEKPKWHAADSWNGVPYKRESAPKRPLAQTGEPMRIFRIADTDVRVLLDGEMSPNDPYISPDWVGTHVIVTVNTRHPFWEVRIETPGDQALYCMMAAIDAYAQWKVAQLNEPPDATEVQKLRDYALRFCTLMETESPTRD